MLFDSHETLVQCNNASLFLSLDLENLALWKPTYQSSTRSGASGSEKAVDNRKSDRTFRGGQCSATLPDTKAIWRVDLKDIYRLDRIVIYFRTENKTWGKMR